MAIFTATDPTYDVSTTSTSTGFYAGLERVTNMEVTSATLPTAISTDTNTLAVQGMTSIVIDPSDSSLFTSSDPESYSATPHTTLASSYYSLTAAASSILGTPSTLSPKIFETSSSGKLSSSSSLPSSVSSSSSGSGSIKFDNNDGSKGKIKLIILGFTSVSLLVGML